jgi:hypothetical protein
VAGVETLCAAIAGQGKDFAPVLATIIATTAALVGFGVKSGLSYLVWSHGERTKTIRLLKAARSEIMTNVKQERCYAGRHFAPILDRFRRESDYHPYAATTGSPPIAKDVADQFDELPASVGPTIYDYYNLSEGLDILIKDWRSDEYKSLPRERKLAALGNLSAVARETCVSAYTGIRKLNKEIVIQENGRKNALMMWGFVSLTLTAILVGLVTQGGLWVASCLASKPTPFKLELSISGAERE